MSKSFLSCLLVLAMLVMLSLIWFGRPRHVCPTSVPKSDINALLSALALYRINYDHYPSAQEGLNALVKSSDGKRAGFMTKIPLDPWGRPYRYVVGPSVPDGVGIYSLGKDGVSATQGNDPDDVNSWRDESATTEEPSIPIMVWLQRVLTGVGLIAFAILVGNVFGRPSGRRKEGAESAGEG